MKKKTILSIGLILGILMLLGGCKAKKSVVRDLLPAGDDELLVQHVINHQPGVANYEIKASAKVTIDETSFNGMMTVRLKGEDELWASIKSAIGIEAVRVYANSDSVWVFSRLLRIKEKGDWGYVKDMVGVPLNMEMLRSVLTRSLMTEGIDWQERNNWSIKKDEDEKWMQPKNNEEEKGLDYRASYLVNRTELPIRKIKVEDRYRLWNVTVDYEDDVKKKIDKLLLKGMDSNYQFEAKLNYITFEEKDKLELPFTKF